jgi:hypothetical protein
MQLNHAKRMIRKCKMFHREQPRYNSNVRAFTTLIIHNAHKSTHSCCLLCRPKSSSTLSPRRHYFYQMRAIQTLQMLIKIFVFTRSLASAKVSIRLYLFLVTTEFVLRLFTCHVVYKSAGNSDWVASDGRWQWPRGLRHELSSPSRTLGWRIRIPLEAWMSV